MIVMAQSKTELEKHLGQITSLPETEQQTQLQPTQRIQYLGFLINSQEMKILLTGERITQVVEACRRARIPLNMGVDQSNREADSNIASHISCSTVVLRAPASEKSTAIDGSFLQDTGHTDSGSHIGTGLVVHQPLVNRKNILSEDPNLVMETDVSMLGWGAVCDGTQLWSQAVHKVT